MNAIERFVEEKLPEVLSCYDGKDLLTEGESEITECLIEDFDALIINHVSDEDAVAMAKSGMRRLSSGTAIGPATGRVGNMSSKDLNDPQDARTFCISLISDMVRKRVRAWCEAGRSGKEALLKKNAHHK